jgi:hypothetical protein
MEIKIMPKSGMDMDENSGPVSGANYRICGTTAWKTHRGLPIMYGVKKALGPAAAFWILASALITGCLPRKESQRFSDAMAARPRAASFAWAGNFSEGLAPVMSAGEAGKFGFVDTSGRLAIEPAFAAVGGFSDHRAAVLREGKWGYLGVTGAMAIAPKFDWAGPFQEGLAAVAVPGGYRFIDTAGRPLDSNAFTEVRGFSQGLAAVKIGDEDSGAWGFIDRRGALVIPPLFAGVPRGFSEGLAAVEVEADSPDRMGFIDTSGGFAIDTLFDAAGDFSEGLAPVGRGRRRGGRFEGVWGFADTSGRLAVEPSFAWAGGFRGGTALVRMRGGNYAVIDRGGTVRMSFPDSIVPIPPLSEDRVPFRLRERYGYLDATGAQALSPRFRAAGSFNEGWARARMGTASEGFWVYVDRMGAYLGGNSVTPVTSRLPKPR